MGPFINLTDIRRSNSAHIPRLPSLISKPVKSTAIKTKLKILNDITEVLSIDIQRFQKMNDSIRNRALTKILSPSNKVRGPVDSSGTLKLRNKINIKCPPGTRKNLLNQCIKIR